MIYSKKLYPYEYEFYRLGGHDTPEGREYYLNHAGSMALESNLRYNVFHERYKIGTNKQIHMPELNNTSSL